MDEMSEYQIRAMDALFEFEKAVTEGELTSIDLQRVMEAAIQDGHQMLQISLTMAITAIYLTGNGLTDEQLGKMCVLVRTGATDGT